MALSVKRPWATSILLHGKDVENRGWSTHYRGWLAIHASNSFDPAGLDPLYQLGYGPSEQERDWPRGYLGAVRLLDVCDGSACWSTSAFGVRTSRCGFWAVDGQKHWRLADPIVFPEPIVGRGQLSVYNVTGEIADKIREAAAVALAARSSA